MKSLKPEYEKPIAVPLGEALKGSGECNVGSSVLVGAIAGAFYCCNVGNSPNCVPPEEPGRVTYCFQGNGAGILL